MSVRVQPKAPSNRIRDKHAGALTVSVTAAPEKGKANAAVIALLSKSLGISKSSIEILHGETSRTKTVRVSGLARNALSELLQRAIETGGKCGS